MLFVQSVITHNNFMGLCDTLLLALSSEITANQGREQDIICSICVLVLIKLLRDRVLIGEF